MPVSHVPLVEITRGSIVESVHYGSLAIVRPDGEQVLALGDNTSPFFLRSSAKPFQALAFIESGGIDHYHLTPEEVAIISASHSGTPQHVQVLEKLQEKTGVKESDLQCGVHPPFHRESELQLQAKGEKPHNNHNNCSGKHTGMLAFAKMISAPIDDYLEWDHPVQRAILNTFAQMCRVEENTIELGLDGCTAPVFALPLPKAAGAFARLCQPDDLPQNRAQACRQIVQAMQTHAFMVGGPDRFDTDMMKAASGKLVSKVGAEGYLGMGILPGKALKIKSSLGVAIKISDGDLTRRAFSVVAIALLTGLGVLEKEELTKLQPYGARPIKNWRGKEIGQIRPSQYLLDAVSSLS